jgi:hypothetical protein
MKRRAPAELARGETRAGVDTTGGASSAEPVSSTETVPTTEAAASARVTGEAAAVGGHSAVSTSGSMSTPTLRRKRHRCQEKHESGNQKQAVHSLIICPIWVAQNGNLWLPRGTYRFFPLGIL